MKLSIFARRLGVSYSTVLRMWHRDEIPGAFKLPSGTIIVPDNILENYSKSKYSEKDIEQQLKNNQEKFNKLKNMCRTDMPAREVLMEFERVENNDSD
jgi:hypothetical protein